MAPYGDGNSRYGHDSSYYGVPAWEAGDYEKYLREQDGKGNGDDTLGGFEHAAIITGSLAVAQALGWTSEYLSCKTKNKYPRVSKGLHYLGAGLTVCLTLARAYMKATGGRLPNGIGSGGHGETQDLRRRLPNVPKDAVSKIHLDEISSA